MCFAKTVALDMWLYIVKVTNTATQTIWGCGVGDLGKSRAPLRYILDVQTVVGLFRPRLQGKWQAGFVADNLRPLRALRLPLCFP